MNGWRNMLSLGTYPDFATATDDAPRLAMRVRCKHAPLDALLQRLGAAITDRVREEHLTGQVNALVASGHAQAATLNSSRRVRRMLAARISQGHSIVMQPQAARRFRFIASAFSITATTSGSRQTFSIAAVAAEKTMSLLALARTLIRGALTTETVPLGVNVAMSAPVSASTTVNDETDWAAAQFGAAQTAANSAERRKRLVEFAKSLLKMRIESIDDWGPRAATNAALRCQ
jgi:hypothetical protein